MNSDKIKKIFLHVVPVSLAAIILLIFICLKASGASFTHDEAYTYLRFVHQNFMDIISYKVSFTNNHILNTLLMKYSEQMFGNTEFVLRLPNAIAFIIYTVFTAKFITSQKSKLLFPFFILMICNPYLIDFFAMGRGYGLSFAFLMMSVYYLDHYFNSRNSKDLIWFHVAAFLGFMSNFSLLNFYIVALATYNIVLYLEQQLKVTEEKKISFLRLNKINLIALVISIAVLYEPIRKILKPNMLDYGGKTGFIEDTIGSLVRGLFYEQELTLPIYTILKYFFFLVMLVVFFLCVFKLAKKDQEFYSKNRTMIVTNFILVGIAMITVMQHYALGNDFYTQRFGLFLYPLFILNLFLLIRYLSTLAPANPIIVGSYAVAFLLVFNFYYCSNTKYFKDWKYDADTKKVMEKVVAEHSADTSKTRKIRLGINWLLEPSTNFYRYKLDLNWLYPTHRKGINQYDNYFYVFRSDSVYNELDPGTVVLTNEISNSVLVKNLD